MSVTIVPNGDAYAVAHEIIAALVRQCPTSCSASFEPHLTLQYIYQARDPAAVADAVERVVRVTPPTEIAFSSLGRFNAPHGIHVRVLPNPGLLRLYDRIKQEIDALGERTYPYTVETWSPHLTLSCSHWSDDELALIQELYGSRVPGFVASRVRVNRRDGDDNCATWVVLRDLTLGGAGAVSAMGGAAA